MADGGGGLSVDIAKTDDESDDVVYVEAEPDESPSNDAAIRAQAGLNSPKGQAQNYDDNQGGTGMTLNLAAESDDDDDGGGVTPNTKKREKANINSPRQPKKNQWGNTGDDSGGVNALVTQVQRPAQGGGGGAESLVTQVQRPAPDDTEATMNQMTTAPENGGLCACFSSLFSCCSGPKPPDAVPMKSTSEMGGRDNQNTKMTQAIPTRNDGGNGETQAKSDPNSRLLSSGDNKEDSVSSSTEYPLEHLLPDLLPEHKGKKCLILDLDETLVHSSFKPIPKPDFIIPVEIDRVVHHVYVLKRPYVDEFLLRTSKHYEIVIFTASLSKYADPLLDKLDIHNVIAHRLFRESCVIHGTAYVKDLRKLGRKLKDSIIVDNSPPSYLFQPTNAVPITSWFDDQADTQLLDFCPVLESTMKDIDDVRKLLDANNKSFRWLCNQAHQPLSKYPHKNVNTFNY